MDIYFGEEPFDISRLAGGLQLPIIEDDELTKGKFNKRILESILHEDGRLEKAVRQLKYGELIQHLREDSNYYNPVFERTLENIRQGLINADKPRRKVSIKNEGKEFVKELKKHPDNIYLLSPRKFEIFTAELLKDLGWSIELTPQTRDGGKDIIATKIVDGFKLMNVVECKRYSPENPVGIEIIRSFGFVIQDLKATMGMVATSSYFTKEAKAKAAEYNWRMNLRDFGALKEMLSKYGTLEMDEGSGLWFPS